MFTFHSALGFLTEPWALLMLIASLLYAIMNHLDEYLLKRLSVGTLTIVSGLFGFLTALVFGIYSIVVNDPTSSLLVGKSLVAQAFGVGALEIVWLVPYLYAINRSGALEAAPLFQSIPVIALGLGLAYGEVPPMIHIIGSFAIIVGGFVLNLMPGTWKLNWLTILLMLFASSVIALIYFVFRNAALDGNFVATAFWSGLGSGCSSLLIFCFWTPYRKQFLSFCSSTNKNGLLYQCINEVLNITSLLLSQRAMMLGPSVMAVSALAAYQPVFILLVGWILTKLGLSAHAEKLRGIELLKRVLAIVCIAIGTGFIAQQT